MVSLKSMGYPHAYTLLPLGLSYGYRLILPYGCLISLYMDIALTLCIYPLHGPLGESMSSFVWPWGLLYGMGPL